MKNIKQFIYESKNFKLDNNERESLSYFIGIICGAIGNKKDQDEFKVIIDSLNEKELKQLTNLYNCLDDINTYKTINRNMIIDDIQLLIKIFKITDDNDLFKENWDLINIYEKIK